MFFVMEKVIFVLEEEWRGASLPDAEEAVRRYREYGVEAEFMVPGTIKYLLTEPEFVYKNLMVPGTINYLLFIADSGRLLKALAGAGAAVCGYRHAANADERLVPADYVLMEPQWVDRDSLTKIWQRQRDLPWTILETDRCMIREFVPEDIDAICDLYDPEARRFLEAPSEDRRREREILDSYIHKVYRLAGYGDWAVINKEDGRLIGRMGFSFPSGAWTAAAKTAPAKAMADVDALFGYLIHADMRGRGIATEAGRAVLEYGFTQLGFESVGADTSILNRISAKILKSFGFVPVAEEANQRYYILKKPDDDGRRILPGSSEE